MQTLLDVKSYYEEQDLLLKFGDIFAANLNRIKNWPRDHEPWLKKATWVTNDWQNISAMIQEEDDQLKKHRQIRKPEGENTNGVKWEIAQAAKRLGISDVELEWEVHTYARRNHMAHLGIAKDAELGDFDEVACILASLREKLGCADIPAKTKSQYDSALQLFEKEYFKMISYKKFFTQGMTPLFVLHDKYEERRQRRIREEIESEKKEQEEEEVRLGRIRQWEADVESGRVNLMGGTGRRTGNMTI